MEENLIARASMTTHASGSRVWNALVNPAAIREYMSGAEMTANWKEGGAFSWKGDWRGKTYEVTGKILKMVPRRRMQFTHSRLRGVSPDLPETFHTVTIDMSVRGRETDVLLSQDMNSSEVLRERSEQDWEIVLDALKKFVEK
jgi:uncharacterized protein YndB with AHSA1/START domain